MAQLDDDIGLVMKKLKDMGEDENTIVVFTTDNGTEVFTWPDGGTTPFAQCKGTIMEGGFRVPCIARWPGKIPADTVQNGIMSGLDWFPTFLAAAGNPNITDQLLKGVKLGDRTYKNHLDGYDQTAMITGKGAVQRATRSSTSARAPSARSASTTTSSASSTSPTAGWARRPRGRAVHHQPAPRSVRAHGLAEQRDQGRRRSSTSTGSSTSSGASCSSSR